MADQRSHRSALAASAPSRVPGTSYAEAGRGGERGRGRSSPAATGRAKSCYRSSQVRHNSTAWRAKNSNLGRHQPTNLRSVAMRRVGHARAGGAVVRDDGCGTTVKGHARKRTSSRSSHEWAWPRADNRGPTHARRRPVLLRITPCCRQARRSAQPGHLRHSQLFCGPAEEQHGCEAGGREGDRHGRRVVPCLDGQQLQRQRHPNSGNTD